MSRTTPQVDPLSAARLTLTGRVQGIGMRPAVARFAQQLGLNGWARNTRHGLEIHLEGTAWGVERFQKEFSHHLPVAARITSLHIASAQPAGHARFVLGGEETLAIDRIATDAIRMEQPLRAAVPPDVVVCDHCLSDVRSTDNRRHGYPFASCTDCGPRYSIIDRMPYERAQTGMSEFPLCDHCRREYASPGDRRFHAQTNACPKCGPSIWLQSTAGRVIARGGDAIRAAAGAILDGRIVALRGLGGYQLLADATSPQAVEQLRAKKKRPSKPLAVMVAGRREAERYAILNDAERQLLQSPAGSIVLLATSEGLHRGSICASVTAGLNTIGLMLPTTPLHSLLLDRLDRPLICTSANVEGDPLIFDSRAAAEQLPALADVVLNHNRPIRRPIDDSVVRVMAGHATAIRLARGYAPLSLEIETDRPIIALGGHLKTSVAISNGVQAVLGPHLGDLETLATRERYVEHVAELRQLYNSDDPNFVCDRHPDYFTSQWAAGQSRQVLQVNHHHAHIVAGMCEQGWLDRAVLGISFDGTGFGNDGTIWGGEILRVTVDHFQRIGMLRPFSLPGGEHAVREP